jgi:hypothetical protein
MAPHYYTNWHLNTQDEEMVPKYNASALYPYTCIAQRTCRSPLVDCWEFYRCPLAFLGCLLAPFFDTIFLSIYNYLRFIIAYLLLLEHLSNGQNCFNGIREFLLLLGCICIELLRKRLTASSNELNIFMFLFLSHKLNQYLIYLCFNSNKSE